MSLLPAVPPPVVAAPRQTAAPTMAPVPAPRPAAPAVTGAAEPSTERPTKAPHRLAGVRISDFSEIGGTLAAGILLAAALRRRRHRRSYQPQPPAPAQLEAQVAKPPALRALLTASTAAVPQSEALAGPGESSANGWELAESPTGPVILPWSDFPQLTLTGPGALDAARAAVATLLIQQPPTVELLVVGPVFADLFADAELPTEIQQPPTLEAALQFLQLESINRSRQLQQAGSADAVAYRDEHPEDPLPQLILISAEPFLLVRGLAELLRQNAHLGISSLLIAPNPIPDATESPAINLAQDGAVLDAQPQQLLDIVAGAVHHLTAEDAALLLRPAPAAVERSTDLPNPDIEPVTTLAPDWSQPLAGAARNTERPIRVQLLGPIRIWVNGQEVTTGLRASARELLAWYLLHPDGRTADAAITAIWPDISLDRGPQYFWTALGNLRSRLRATGDAKPIVLNKAAGAYRPESDELTVDLWTFQAALQDAATAINDAHTEPALRRAVNSYHGAFATDADYLWADTVRDELHRRALDAHTALAGLLATGEPLAAIAVYERILDLDPHHEDTYRKLINLQHQAGQTESIRMLWKQLLVRLSEIGAEPEPETVRLHRDLVR